MNVAYPRPEIGDSTLSVASVCRALPTPGDPSAGLFVMRRLAAVARRTSLRVLQPIPYFPLLRPLPAWAKSASHDANGLEVEHLPMFYWPKIFKSRDGGWLFRSIRNRLRELQRADKLDLIDAHFGYPDGAGCVMAARELKVPAVVTLRGVEEDYMQIPAIARQIRTSLQAAQGCICVSHTLRELAISAGVTPEAAVVIHNAVNREVFQPRSLREAKARAGVAIDAPLVLSVGNLLSVKRHTVLIVAFSRLLQSYPSARLVIVGGAMHEPQYPDELQSLCAALGVAEQVTFTGKLDESDVAGWLNAADVFALASRREGCCNAILEALACGVPVVATSVGDNPHFVQDHENGFLVAVDDAEAMTAGLLMSLQRPEWDRDRISSKLPAGDWDSVATKVVGFMQDCVSTYRQQPGKSN